MGSDFIRGLTDLIRGPIGGLVLFTAILALPFWWVCWRLYRNETYDKAWGIYRLLSLLGIWIFGLYKILQL
jgi:hypothetical protein